MRGAFSRRILVARRLPEMATADLTGRAGRSAAASATQHRPLRPSNGARSRKEHVVSAMSRFKSIRLVMLFAVAIAGIALAGSPARTSASSPAAAVSAYSADDATKLITGSDGVLRFDVAENATNYAWAGDPELVDGLPTQRTAFFTQGYIYPEGTLTASNGVLADGSPEFPDKVLGQWTCWGWFQGAEAPAGMARWITEHLFNFGGEFGEATLATEGYSIDAMDVSLERAVVGGTGTYAAASGVQLETNLGFNASNGINVRYEIRLAGA
jgi:hypothetical protein